MEKFLYVRPDDDENVHMMWGPLPRFWGYESKEALIASAKVENYKDELELAFDEDFDFDDFVQRGYNERRLNVVGPVWVHAVRVESSKSYDTYFFKLCGPVTLHTTQQHYEDIFVDSHVMNDTESEYHAYNAQLIPEDLVPAYMDHMRRSAELDREWIQLLNQCRARLNLDELHNTDSATDG